MGSGRTARGAIALVLALVVGGGLGFGLYVADEKGALPVALGPARATPSPPAEPPPGATGLAATSAAGSDSPEPPPSPAASSSADAAGPVVSADACMRSLFPEDTFVAEPEMPFVCDENAAGAAVSRLKTQLVVAGRGRPATGGMKEWAVLGFYELAALALVRGRCCPSAAPLTIADADPCELAEAVHAVGDASKSSASKEELDAAVKQFDGEVRCLMKIQQTKRFGYEPLLGGEASTFEKTAARLPR